MISEKQLKERIDFLIKEINNIKKNTESIDIIKRNKRYTKGY